VMAPQSTPACSVRPGWPGTVSCSRTRPPGETGRTRCGRRSTVPRRRTPLTETVRGRRTVVRWRRRPCWRRLDRRAPGRSLSSAQARISSCAWPGGPTGTSLRSADLPVPPEFSGGQTPAPAASRTAEVKERPEGVRLHDPKPGALPRPGQHPAGPDRRPRLPSGLAVQLDQHSVPGPAGTCWSCIRSKGAPWPGWPGMS